MPRMSAKCHKRTNADAVISIPLVQKTVRSLRGIAIFKLRSACGTRAGDQQLDLRQNTLHDNVDAIGIRMFAVELNNPRIICHTVKDVWIPDERISLGKRRIDGIEGAYIAGALVARRPKPSEEHLNMTIFESAQ